MDLAERVRLQIRVVLVVFRGEVARMDRWNLTPATRKDFTNALQLRSFQVLDAARATLNGTASEHPDLLRELDTARAEISAGNIG